jgi:hypothetical protein
MAHTIRWEARHGIHDAVVNGRQCRIVLYPASSPLAGRYGCYLDGQYKGVANSIDTAKSRCRTLTSFAGTSRERINLRTWQSR